MVMYIAYDISTRTTFPGSERLENEEENIPKDTNDAKIDSIKTLEYL